MRTRAGKPGDVEPAVAGQPPHDGRDDAAGCRWPGGRCRRRAMAPAGGGAGPVSDEYRARARPLLSPVGLARGRGGVGRRRHREQRAADGDHVADRAVQRDDGPRVGARHLDGALAVSTSTTMSSTPTTSPSATRQARISASVSPSPRSGSTNVCTGRWGGSGGGEVMRVRRSDGGGRARRPTAAAPPCRAPGRHRAGGASRASAADTGCRSR